MRLGREHAVRTAILTSAPSPAKLQVFSFGLVLLEIAIGDGDNDLPMLRAAGIGVLMGNAKPEVRRLAEGAHIEVGPSLEEEGFSATISRYVEDV